MKFKEKDFKFYPAKTLIRCKNISTEDIKGEVGIEEFSKNFIIGCKVNENIIRRCKARKIKFIIDKGNRILDYESNFFWACLHPVWAHNLDVAASINVLFESYFSPKMREHFCLLLGLDEIGVQSFLTYIAAIHDIGKVSPDFFFRLGSFGKSLAKFGFLPDIKECNLTKRPVHGEVSCQFYFDFLKNDLVLDKTLLCYIGGHHGGKISSKTYKDNYWAEDLKNEDKNNFLDAAKEEWAKIKLGLDKISFPVVLRKNQKRAFMEVYGLLVLADWIGSDPTIYGDDKEIHLYNKKDEFESYFDKTKVKVYNKIREIGLIHREPKFLSVKRDIFSNKKIELSELQELCKKSSALCSIAAANCGDGKTAAALLKARELLIQNKIDGIVIAMPTRATANALTAQMTSFSKSLKSNINIVHSGLNKAEIDYHIFSGENKESFIKWNTKNSNAIYGSKIIIGTIDQFLSGVMSHRHNLIRQFSLNRKLLVIDEIHSYDRYTFTLILNLIKFCCKKGIYVHVMTATLSKKDREELLKYMHCHKNINIKGYPYLINYDKTSGLEIFYPKSRKKSREINIEIKESTTELLSEKISFEALSAAQSGANVAIIVNRVSLAQEIYKRCLIYKIPTILYHSRFFEDHKKEIEKNILNLFGPNCTERPKGYILIGTQILEQSIDIDFDYLITEISPLESLLQRMGRLFRHPFIRPKGYEVPKCCIFSKIEEEGKEKRDYREETHFPYSISPIISVEEFLKTVKVIKEPDIFISGMRAVYDEPEISDDYKQIYLDKRFEEEKEGKERAQKALLQSSFSAEPLKGDFEISYASTREFETVTLCFLEDGEYYFTDEKGIDYSESRSSISLPKNLLPYKDINYPIQIVEDWKLGGFRFKYTFEDTERTGLTIIYPERTKK